MQRTVISSAFWFSAKNPETSPVRRLVSKFLLARAKRDLFPGIQEKPNNSNHHTYASTQNLYNAETGGASNPDHIG